MTKQILLLGEFSTGKSAFINMLLGVSILPERVTSTDLPVVKVYSGKPAGIWLREPNQKNPQALDSWSDIPKDWSSFQHAEITIPNHPLLAKDLIIWDTPGINSTNEHHKKHLENFLNSNPKQYDLVYFFLHGNITSTSLDFLKAYKWLWERLTILVNIKEIKPESECRMLEKEVKKIIRTQLGVIPVELLYIGDVCEQFNELSEEKRNGANEYELVKDWSSKKIELDSMLKNRFVIGEEHFGIISEIAHLDNDVKFDSINNQEIINQLAYHDYIESANKNDADAQYNVGRCYALGIGIFKSNVNAIYWYKRAAINGNKYAQFELANAFENGIELEHDINQAVHWYEKASQQDHKHAKERLERLLSLKQLNKKQEETTHLVENNSIPRTDDNINEEFIALINDTQVHRFAKDIMLEEVNFARKQMSPSEYQAKIAELCTALESVYNSHPLDEEFKKSFKRIHDQYPHLFSLNSQLFETILNRHEIIINYHSSCPFCDSLFFVPIREYGNWTCPNCSNIVSYSAYGFSKYIQESGSSDCFIATAVYGGVHHEKVNSLREYRDLFLMTNKWGQILVKFYYKHSPRIAACLKYHHYSSWIIRKVLDIIIKLLIEPKITRS